MNREQWKKYAPLVVRITMSLVFLWFGLNQLFDTASFLGYLPKFASSIPIAPTTLILMNGFFDTFLGAMLLIGFLTRIIALIASLHLLGIAFGLGYNDIMVRDVGLSIIAFSIFLYGSDQWCLNKKLFG